MMTIKIMLSTAACISAPLAFSYSLTSADAFMPVPCGECEASVIAAPDLETGGGNFPTSIPGAAVMVQYTAGTGAQDGACAFDWTCFASQQCSALVDGAFSSGLIAEESYDAGDNWSQVGAGIGAHTISTGNYTCGMSTVRVIRFKDPATGALALNVNTGDTFYLIFAASCSSCWDFAEEK